MKKIYVTQTCSKFTPILKIFYKNLKEINFFDQLIVYTDDKRFNPDDTFVKVIYGKDANYSRNLKNAVDSSDVSCFFCGCEDYIFIKDKINIDHLNDIWKYFQLNPSIGILRLNRASCINDKSNLIEKKLGVYEVPKKYAYCVNLQPCIWRKDFFYKLYEDKLNAWHFETKLSSKAIKHDYLCTCTRDNSLPLINGNKKGSSYRDIFVDMVDENGREIDFGSSMVYVKRNGIKKMVSYSDYIGNNRFNEIR